MHMYSVSRTAYLLDWLQVNVYRGLSADVDVQRRQRAVHVPILRRSKMLVAKVRLGCHGYGIELHPLLCTLYIRADLAAL